MSENMDQVWFLREVLNLLMRFGDVFDNDNAKKIIKGGENLTCFRNKEGNGAGSDLQI